MMSGERSALEEGELSTMCNHDNPVSGIHPGTITPLTSGTKHYCHTLYMVGGGVEGKGVGSKNTSSMSEQ